MSDTSEEWIIGFWFLPDAFHAATTRGCYNLTFALCFFPPRRLHIKLGSPAEIQHGLHSVHARGPQHAPHLRLDGQNPGLPPPQPPAQIPASVHWRTPPSGRTEAGRPTSSCGASKEAPCHTPQSRPARWQAESRRSPRKTRAPELSAGDAWDVEALVKSCDLGCSSC